MAGRVSFKIEVQQTNLDVLPEMAGRMKNLGPMFEKVIDEWAYMNAAKFDAAANAGASGLQIDPTVYWQPLSQAYLKQKMRAGFGAGLMTRTGSLRQAMTDPEGFFRMTTETQAAFGMPNDAEDALKVQYNWPTAENEKRQVIFLSLEDQRMIQKHVQDYLSLGPNYQEVMFARGVDAVKLRKEIAELDAEFADAAAS